VCFWVIEQQCNAECDADSPQTPQTPAATVSLACSVNLCAAAAQEAELQQTAHNATLEAKPSGRLLHLLRVNSHKQDISTLVIHNSSTQHIMQVTQVACGTALY
jgi:hypothetical protein